MRVNMRGSQRTIVGRGNQTRVIGLVASDPNGHFMYKSVMPSVTTIVNVKGVLGKLTVPAAVRADVLNTHAGLQFVAATTLGGSTSEHF